MKARVNTRVIIAYNSFYNNGGYVDSSIIHFRARALPGVNLATEIPTQSKLFCTGYLIQSNYFERNYGCYRSGGGLIKFECLNDADVSSTPNDQISVPDVSTVT